MVEAMLSSSEKDVKRFNSIYIYIRWGNRESPNNIFFYIFAGGTGSPRIIFYVIFLLGGLGVNSPRCLTTLSLDDSPDYF